MTTIRIRYIKVHLHFSIFCQFGKSLVVAWLSGRNRYANHVLQKYVYILCERVFWLPLRFACTFQSVEFELFKMARNCQHFATFWRTFRNNDCFKSHHGANRLETEVEEKIISFEAMHENERWKQKYVWFRKMIKLWNFVLCWKLECYWNWWKSKFRFIGEDAKDGNTGATISSGASRIMNAHVLTCFFLNKKNIMQHMK